MVLNGSSILIIILFSITYLCDSDIFVRKNVNHLTHNEWQEFKRGIKLMKEIDLNNKNSPFGYNYQANIHGWPDFDGTDRSHIIAKKNNWQRCQHSSYFFLVWHRMYIYFFEKILRKVSNNAKITLPYWDVFEGNSRSIPLPFRVPADNVTNPLYVSQRCTNMNRGKPFSEKVVNPYPALNTNFFSTFKQNNELNVCHSFGGGMVDEPVFDSDRSGLLERIPHDYIHLFVGGPTGHMSDLCTSTRDPMFFILHSNTDRIWESWLSAGGKNPTEAKYLNQTFDFYDETEKLNSYRVGDFLVAKELGYKYDSLIYTNQVNPTRSAKPKLYLPINERESHTINSKKRYLTVSMKPQWIPFLKKYVDGHFDGLNVKFTLQFDLDYLEPDHIFEIYLNLDSNTVPSDSHPNFVGNMVRFIPKCVPQLPRKHFSISKCYDITENLKTILLSDYNFNGYIPRNLSLSFVPKFCDKTSYPKTNEDLIRFNQIVLVFHKVNANNGLMFSNITSKKLLKKLKKSIKDLDNTLMSIPDATAMPDITEPELR